MKNFLMILRIIGIVLASLMLIWFLIPIAFGILNPGNILGILMNMYFLFRLISRSKYKAIRNKLRSKKATKILWNGVNLLMCIFGVYAIAISTCMLVFSNISPAPNATAIVLGAKVQPDDRPSIILKGRINAGSGYLKNNIGTTAVLSGGKGNDENISEAQCIYDNLIMRSVPCGCLYKEDKSTNTYENIKNSYKIIEKYKLNKNIAIVTDGYHQLRARIIAQKQGITSDIGCACAPVTPESIWFYPTYFVREWIAIPVELVKPSV